MRMRTIVAALVPLLAAIAPAAAAKMASATYGCREIEDLKGIRSMRDGAERDDYVRRKIASDVCTLMFEGEPVAVLDRSWSGYQKIETPEDGAKYWIEDGHVTD